MRLRTAVRCFQGAVTLTPIAPPGHSAPQVQAGRILRVKANASLRSGLPRDGAEVAMPMASREGQAIQILVGQPLGDWLRLTAAVSRWMRIGPTKPRGFPSRSRHALTRRLAP